MAFAPGRLVKQSYAIHSGPKDRAELRILDRDTVELFLDEDPELAYRGLTVEVAGTRAFVPDLPTPIHRKERAPRELARVHTWNRWQRQELNPASGILIPMRV